MVSASKRNAAAKKRTANARMAGRLGKNAPSTAEALRLQTKYAKASKKANSLLARKISQKNSAFKKLQAAQKVFNKAENAEMHAQFAATSNAQLANRYARSASGALSARRAYNQGAKSALNSRTNATHGRLTRAATAARTAGALVRNHVIRPYHNAASISGYGW